MRWFAKRRQQETEQHPCSSRQATAIGGFGRGMRCRSPHVCHTAVRSGASCSAARQRGGWATLPQMCMTRRWQSGCWPSRVLVPMARDVHCCRCRCGHQSQLACDTTPSQVQYSIMILEALDVHECANEFVPVRTVAATSLPLRSWAAFE